LGVLVAGHSNHFFRTYILHALYKSFNVYFFIMRTTMRSVLLSLLPLAVLGARKRDVASTAFQLYAYGEDIGGFPLFYDNGLAYVGEPALSNSTDAAVVICEFSFFCTIAYPSPSHQHT
jgi:hypothetical protein